MAGPRPLLDEAALAATVRRLGEQIAADHPDGVVLVGILKGALLFLADLVRAVPDVPVAVDFMAISRFAPDSGRVRILQDVALDLGGRDVVIVEDIVDTGLTVAYLRSQLAGRAPRRVSVCTLLDRPGRRIAPEPVRYAGLAIGDEFVLGYGLHHRDLYRNVPFVSVADQAAVVARPDVHVRDLYGREVPGDRAGDGDRAGRPERPDDLDGRVTVREEAP